MPNLMHAKKNKIETPGESKYDIIFGDTYIIF